MSFSLRRKAIIGKRVYVQGKESSSIDWSQYLYKEEEHINTKMSETISFPIRNRKAMNCVIAKYSLVASYCILSPENGCRNYPKRMPSPLHPSSGDRFTVTLSKSSCQFWHCFCNA